MGKQCDWFSGGSSSFTLSQPYGGSCFCYFNGILQSPESWSLAGQVCTFNFSTQSGDSIAICYDVYEAPAPPAPIIPELCLPPVAPPGGCNVPFTFATVAPLISVDKFRADFPEFANSATYSENTIRFWLAIGQLRLRASRWQSLFCVGLELYAAHNIVIEATAQQTALAGGFPGTSKGAITAQTVDKVTLSYDAALTSEEGAGNYNLTVYGTRFWELSQLVGMGPIQVGPGGPCGPFEEGFPGAGFVPDAQNTLTGGWSGPCVKPGNFSS